MSVFVDYVVGSSLYSVYDSPAFTDPTSAQVQARGDSVYGYLGTLEAAADAAGDAAEARIQALRDFNAAVGPVQFVVPPAPGNVLVAFPELETLLLNLPDLQHSSLSDNFNYKTADAVEKSANPPTEISYTTPDAPGLTTPQPLPNAPADYDFPETQPPTLDVAPYSPTEVAAPSIIAPEFDSGAGDFTIDPLGLTVDTSALEAAIAAYENYDPTPPTLPEYVYLIPEIFSVVGAMAGGGGLDYDSLTAESAELVAGIVGETDPQFTRRGLYRVRGAAEYDTWLKNLSGSHIATSDVVFAAKARDSLISAAFELGTAAHRLLTDIEIALFDLEFRAAKAAVIGSLNRAQIAATVYNAEVLIFRGHVAEYNAVAAQVAAKAQAFEVLASQVAVLGQVNSTIADAFSAQERAKQAAARTFKAQVEAEAAKLAQYRAILQSYAAQVEAARSAVAQYGGDVTRYVAEMERLSAEFDRYAATARAKQTENAAIAATVQADQTEFRALAVEASSSATKAAAKATQLQARAAVDETEYIKKALRHNEDGMKFTQDAGEFNLTMTNYIAELAGRATELGSTSALARAVSSYVTAAGAAVGRAAELSQTANKQLAAAYETVYKAAGQAGAEVASGKLSGFRATAAMSAKESLQASRAYDVNVTSSGSKNYEETDDYRASISV